MSVHRSLSGEVFDLGQLSAEQREAYREAKAFYDTNPEWTEFSNFWRQKARKLFAAEAPVAMVKEPLYRILQDLDSRLGIRQGYAREPDYRDLLEDIISRHFKSRYQFCKETGMDEGYLSSVLGKKKHLSIEKLQEIMDKTNYRICFVEK